MIEVNKQEDQTTITVEGTNRVTVTNAAELREAITNALQNGKQNVTLDLDGIKYMDSTAISVLITGVKVARENNLKFSVMHVHDEVLKLLRLMKIDKIIDIR